jgi:hypothetical protein
VAADEIYQFTVVTPAGTLQAAPLVTPTVFGPRIVERIAWRVPAGSLGVMGWQVGMRGVQVIPRNAGGFIVAHETAGGWDLEDMPDSGDWSVTTYNTGLFQHALYVTFHVRLIRPAPVIIRPLPSAVLAGQPSPDFAGSRY